MAPSYRHRNSSSHSRGVSGPEDADDDNVLDGKSFAEGEKTMNRRNSNVWERRRRRFEKSKSMSQAMEQQAPSAASGAEKELKTKNRRSRSQSHATEIDEDMDPYDSDPGESYRQHCMRVNGVGTRTCLAVPGFMKSKRIAESGETVLTAPPSPMASEMGDMFGQTPASLPPNMQRVRYSLRSSITDGAEKQPMGPTVMERRELRPNNVQMNVSHWSDTGGRPYMEDR
jgi:hypothetical protein